MTEQRDREGQTDRQTDRQTETETERKGNSVKVGIVQRETTEERH